MKRIVRYLLDGDGAVPNFITDGGYFPIGGELVGVSIDDEQRFLPTSVKKLSKQELVDRVVGRSRKPFFNDVYTEETALDFVNTWLSNRGITLE